MDYKKHYDLLIQKRKESPVPDNVYSENHHIIPSCMGGTNEPDNMVRLTPKEHYIAHALLYKQYRSSKLAHAWFSMLRTSENQERMFTAKQYERARNAHVSVLKETMVGEGNPFYGKSHTEETRKHISKRIKEWHEHNRKSEEQIQNWIEKVAKKPASDKQKEAARRSSKNKVMLKNIETGECVKVDRSLVSNYNTDLWKNPACNQRREKCVYCGMESVVGNIKRWHNDKCKHKT